MTNTYSLSTAIFGGTAPLTGAYLIKTTGSLAAPGVYLVAMGLLAAPVALHVCVKRRRDNRLGSSVEDPRESAERRSRPVSSSIP